MTVAQVLRRYQLEATTFYRWQLAKEGDEGGTVIGSGPPEGGAGEEELEKKSWIIREVVEEVLSP